MTARHLAPRLHIVEGTGGKDVAECALEHAIVQRVAGGEPSVCANLFGRDALVAAYRYRIGEHAARGALRVRRYAREANRERKEKKSRHSG